MNIAPSTYDYENPNLILARQLLQKLSFLKRVELNEEVREREQVWILTGNTPTYYAKQIAQETIKNLAAKARIINQVSVGKG